ncbi:MAG: iron-sulfur cluster carrier protein ApbC [Gammaproteobacteria bacterium]|nr:MAG: iron-sulfur cluster carrier protein ApbC [Gammaproteobacteria bacterium]
MADVSHEAVNEVLKAYQDPYWNTDPLSAGWVRVLEVEGGAVRVGIELPYPARGLAAGMAQVLENQLLGIDGVESASVDVTWFVEAVKPAGQNEPLPGVKNVIAVASGKGGVGKSTTAVNLALALSAEGARVGVLDADIYGPSMGMMLGVPAGTRPALLDEKTMKPVEAQGLQVMSMAFLVDEKQAMVWRGPMATGALIQMLGQTHWDNLDYLVVDMPPGTGDIQLTLAQKVPVSGSIIVTTPQDIALLDCKRGIEMFRKVDIPVLGVVENMSIHICSQCGHHEALFGEGGGERIAEEYGVELLGQLPLHKTIREQADGGLPTVAAEPESEVALIYRDIARRTAANLAKRMAEEAQAAPEIIVKTWE